MKNLIITAVLLMTQVAWAAEPTIGLKNFKSIYYSLANATGVKPTQAINDYYKSVMTRFPKDGRVNEMSSSLLLAAKGVAGMFCKEFSKTYQAPNDVNAMLSDLSQRFYGRQLSVGEAKELTDLVNKTSPQTNKSFLVCTAMTSSIEFLVQP